ncbi:MAG: tRNA (guanosine(46)-N7)-methyltransferase TrmB [Rhizobiaceae bacterium]|nr:tRNA (guanosine(46)-N7)-methyltransferase TrmB [Rhizobiaceae bacterium]
MTDEARPSRLREAFYGRVKGKRLRPRQEELMSVLLPKLALDLSRPPPEDLHSLFAADVTAVRLEIGFGGGEHLLSMADRFPEIGFIGVEPFVNGMAKLLMVLDEAPRPNIRIYNDDATRLLDWLPEASIAGVDLLYPDPWPKFKHWKRRFVSAVNLDRLARVLDDDAPFRFASDIDTYVNWTLLHIRAHPAFDWAARGPSDWRAPYEGWPGTRYEAKAFREGRTAAYLTFRRAGR